MLKNIKKRYSLFHLFSLLFLFLCIYALTEIPGIDITIKSIPYYIRVILPFLIYTLFLVYMIFIIGKNNIKSELRISIKKKDVFMGFLSGSAVFILTILVVALFPTVADKSEQLFPDTSKLVNPFVFIYICIYIPFIEELIFRGFIWKIFEEKRMNGIIIVFLTSFLFALYHLEFYNFPNLFISGIIIGLLRLNTNRMGASIVAHVTNNIIVYVVMVLFAPWLNSLT